MLSKGAQNLFGDPLVGVIGVTKGLNDERFLQAHSKAISKCFKGDILDVRAHLLRLTYFHCWGRISTTSPLTGPVPPLWMQNIFSSTEGLKNRLCFECSISQPEQPQRKVDPAVVLKSRQYTQLKTTLTSS